MAADLARVFRALAHTDRLAILNALCEGPSKLGIEELAERAGISRFAASHHLATLRDAELLLMERQQQRRVHRLNLTTLRDIEDWAYQFAELAGNGSTS